MLLRPTTTTKTINTRQHRQQSGYIITLTLIRKTVKDQDIILGNSSAGGSSSVVRPGISYNPSGSIVYGGKGGGGINKNNQRSKMMTMQNNNNNNNEDGTNNSQTSESLHNNNDNRMRLVIFVFVFRKGLHSKVLDYNCAVEAAELKASSNNNANASTTI